jgi:hypothetical protein
MNVEKPWLNSFREGVSARRALACVSKRCTLLIRRGNFDLVAQPRAAGSRQSGTQRGAVCLRFPMTRGQEPMKRQKDDAQKSVASL